jgi:urea transport system substrate-binding protein
MEAHFIGFKMWVNAVRQTGTTDIGAVRQALYGQRVTSLSGYNVALHSNHHLEKPVMIGTGLRNYLLT